MPSAQWGALFWVTNKEAMLFKQYSEDQSATNNDFLWNSMNFYWAVYETPGANVLLNHR